MKVNEKAGIWLLIRNEEAGGSNPLSSTRFFKRLPNSFYQSISDCAITAL